MFKNIAYFWMTLAVLLLDIFILNQLSIAMWLRPMLFPLIVVLLPMEWRTIWVLLATLVVGLAMDLSLGGDGLYSATLLPMAVMRSSILYITTRRSVEAGDQTSLLSRMSLRQLMIYVGVMLLVHHTLFFMLESLSFATPLHLVATIPFSTSLSLVMAWPIVRLFTSKIVTK
jgi:hypothetical protein